MSLETLLASTGILLTPTIRLCPQGNGENSHVLRTEKEFPGQSPSTKNGDFFPKINEQISPLAVI
jgi:hypothetical protein